MKERAFAQRGEIPGEPLLLLPIGFGNALQGAGDAGIPFHLDSINVSFAGLERMTGGLQQVDGLRWERDVMAVMWFSRHAVTGEQSCQNGGVFLLLGGSEVEGMGHHMEVGSLHPVGSIQAEKAEIVGCAKSGAQAAAGCAVLEGQAAQGLYG